MLGLEFFAPRGFLFFFFFLHQLGDNVVDDGVAFVFAHSRQSQQTVLEVNVLAVYGQFVQHIGAAFECIQSREVVRQLGHSLRVARLGQLVLVLLVIQPAEFHLRQGFVYAVACGFLGRQDIIGHGTYSVAVT